YGACAVSSPLHLVLARSCGPAVDSAWATSCGRAGTLDSLGEAIHKPAATRLRTRFRRATRIAAGVIESGNDLLRRRPRIRSGATSHDGKRSLGQASSRCTRAQSKPGPGSFLSP